MRTAARSSRRWADRTAASMRAILEANSKPGTPFQILSNPEFLSEGTAVQDLLHPDRVLIGSLDTAQGHRAAELLSEVYERWVPKERVLRTGLWSSELTKLVRASTDGAGGECALPHSCRRSRNPLRRRNRSDRPPRRHHE